MNRGGSRTRWLLAALATVLLGLLAVDVQTGWIEYRSRRPPRGAVARPTDFAALRDVTLHTSDGLTLRGWWVPSKNSGAVLLAHGYGATRMELLPEARLLAANGYGALLFDLRAHGASDGEISTFGDLERHDLEAALAFVAAQPGVASVGLLGVSVAGPPTALVAAADPRAVALVLRSSVVSMAEAAHDEYRRLRWLRAPAARLTLALLGIDVDAVDAHAAVRRYAPRPLLILHGRRDDVVPVERAEALFADASEPKQLEIFEAGDHSHLRSADPQRYDALLTAFFARTLLPQPE